MPRVIHFEIHAENVERAQKFYENIFGWKLDKWGGPMDYWSITTGKEGEPGIDGGLMKRQGEKPGKEMTISSYVCTIEVPDIDEYLDKIKQHGGKLYREKSPIPGIGWLAYCFDTEKNLFGIMQPDTNAR